MVLFGAEHAAHDIQCEATGHGRADGQHAVAVVAELRQSPADHLAYTFGKMLGNRFGGADPAAVDALQRSTFGEMAQDLGYEERIALRLAEDCLREQRRALLLADRCR